MDLQGTLVLVESDGELRERLAAELHALGFVVFTCRNAAEALRLLWVSPPGRIQQLWLELELSDLSGTDFLWYALETKHVFTRIVLAAVDFEVSPGDWERAGPNSRIVCLKTPVDFTEVLQAMGKN